MNMTTPLQEFDALVSANDILFIVYYRGHWCPFCNTYLRTLQSLTSTISTPRPSLAITNVKILAITSESASFTQTTRDKTSFQGQIIVDEKNEIAKELKKRGVVDVAISEKKGYAHGMAQPAVVVLGRGGVVLESWAIVPGAMNLGGAKDRPDLQQIWDNVLAKLRKEKPVHKVYKTQGAMGVLFGKVFG